ncbi:MAG: carbohydrate kinase family protein [Pseudomonadales bacterium]|jgi:adenosine kinase
MPKVLVSGSTAIDLIGAYSGSYLDHAGVEALNVSLQLSSLATSFGGCAMNIAYGLNALGVEAIPLSVVGADFRDRYEKYLAGLGINIDNVVIDDSVEHGAMGIMTSDCDGNQITLFYPGADGSKLRKFPRDVVGITDCQLAIVAPEGAPIMLHHARDLQSLGIPAIFDPGQCLPEFSKQEVNELLDLCQYTIVNEYEIDMLLKISDLSQQAVIDICEWLIVTKAAVGVDIFIDGQCHHIPSTKINEILDPTGCGDAFRVGLIYGMTKDCSAIDCARYGNLVAARNLTSINTQNYKLNARQLEAEFVASYSGS